MNIDSLTIGEAKQIAAQIAPLLHGQVNGRDFGLQIVVLDKGFVYIGNVTIADGWLHIANAWNIRYWGTEKGLGELVNGPTAKTKLDHVGNVVAPSHALIHLIAVEADKWQRKLSA